MRQVPRRYKQVLCRFMTFYHERENDDAYDPDTQQFTDEELLSITPDDLVRWLNLRCFGVQQPTADMRPTLARSQSVKFWKKCISFFMPNRHMQWNNQSNVGNPTRSTQVNELLREMILAETRLQGAPSRARRSTTSNEFSCIQSILKEEGDTDQIKYGYRAHNNYQYHLIGWIDDCTQARLNHLEKHDSFDFCLKTKLNWSKNVREERDCPWQVVIGSNNSLFCVLITLALWLELMIAKPYGMATEYLFGFSSDIRIPYGGRKHKTNLQNHARDHIFNREEFLVPGSTNVTQLGSHSIRKHAASVCRNRGCSRDEKDHRGRWKSRGRASDIYDDVELPYV